jgi:hypothetical protein
MKGCYRGEISLIATHIRSVLNCEGGSFEPKRGSIALYCNRVRIDSAIFFRREVKCKGQVLLAGAYAGALHDDLESWNSASYDSTIVLDGFRYDRIGDAPVDAKSRIAWLNKQRIDHLQRDFRPQPWKQLARVLADMGREEDAKIIRIEMRKLWRRSSWRYRDTWWKKVCWCLRTRFDWLLGFVGYGYRPWRAIWAFVIVWIVGIVIYANIAPLGVMAPNDPKIYKDLPRECRIDLVNFSGPQLHSADQIKADADRREQEATKFQLNPPNNRTWVEICKRAVPLEYTSFEPTLYSLDVVVPVLNLGQKARWAPRTVDEKGDVLGELFTLPRVFGGTWGLGHLALLWQLISTMAALFFSLLLAGSISGLIKKE